MDNLQHAPGEAPIEPGLAGLARQLDEMLASLHAQYVDITGSVRPIAERARRISDQLNEVKRLTESNESDHAIGTLRGMLQSADQVREVARVSLTSLQRVLGSLREGKQSLTQLARIPVFLNSLVMLARVEGVRLSNSSAGSILAADLKALSQQISGHVRSMTSETDSLLSEITASLKRLQSIDCKEEREASELIDRTRGVLDPLHERVLASQRTALDVREQYTSIRSEIEKLVVSLQMEDIARQRIEHVRDVLAQVSNTAESGKVLMLQRAQLVSTRQAVEGSLEELVHTFRNLAPRISELASVTGRLNSEVSRDGHALQRTITEGAQAIAETYTQYSRDAGAILATVQSVLDSVHRLSTEGKEIERTQAAIRRTALNARIETSRLGKDGEAMRAVASEVHAITIEGRKDMESILQCLAETNSALLAMSVDQEKETAASTLLSRSVEEIRAEIHQFSTAVANSTGAILAILSPLPETARQLSDEVETCRNVAQSAVNSCAMFESVIGALDREIGALHLDPAAEIDGATFDLANRYSMQSERDVHQQVFSSANAVPSSEIDDGVELF